MAKQVTNSGSKSGISIGLSTFEIFTCIAYQCANEGEMDVLADPKSIKESCI